MFRTSTFLFPSFKKSPAELRQLLILRTLLAFIILLLDVSYFAATKYPYSDFCREVRKEEGKAWDGLRSSLRFRSWSDCFNVASPSPFRERSCESGRRSLPGLRWGALPEVLVQRLSEYLKPGERAIWMIVKSWPSVLNRARNKGYEWLFKETVRWEELELVIRCRRSKVDLYPKVAKVRCPLTKKN